MKICVLVLPCNLVGRRWHLKHNDTGRMKLNGGSTFTCKGLLLKEGEITIHQKLKRCTEYGVVYGVQISTQGIEIRR
jgi:hypothetical protein